MNERILELAKKAGLSYIPSSNNGPLRVEYLFPELEKFAELIVRECSQFVEDRFDFCGDEITIAEKIKEHFGVKE